MCIAVGLSTIPQVQMYAVQDDMSSMWPPPPDGLKDLQQALR
jgi:hypothetical protein